ncbi:hypothetical protein HSBAA_19290 [Vreelandella sulfidaeris]|uniref:UDP-glucose/GDP-mannose dehydrogenase N-terminal domain-containing protein n=1 Tax=Vreelandella sulfidaeris TaxID=115553 RepID=A0A455U5Y8_9GAMM|nr:hypothetical protein HSBAA_19290 [Halomonas sulfidaeris]
MQFIAVGTPPDEDGSADLQYVLKVAETIAEHMQAHRIIVDNLPCQLVLPIKYAPGWPGY